MRLPEGWRQLALAKVADVQTGLSKSATRTGKFVTLPYLRVANVQAGYFDLSEIKQIEVPVDAVERYRVRSEDLLLTEGGDFDKLGRGALWAGQIQHCVHQNHVFVVRARRSILDPRFLTYQTQGPFGRAYFLSCAKQSTNLASINSTQLRQFPTLVAPLPEQERIADILEAWDEALKQLDALITAKERLKMGLMQQLLSHQLSYSRRNLFPYRLGDIVRRITRKNNIGNNNVLTISAQFGLVSQQEYFDRSVAGNDLSKYYLIKNGEFAYNRSAASGYPFGAVKRLERYDAGIVSTLYICFQIYDGVTASPDYLAHYFEGGFLNQGLRAVAKEGARAHGLLNITADEFFDLDVFLPPIEMQSKVARTLNTCDDELKILRQQRDSIELQKRGLMQQLLTGRIRVKVP